MTTSAGRRRATAEASTSAADTTSGTTSGRSLDGRGLATSSASRRRWADGSNRGSVSAVAQRSRSRVRHGAMSSAGSQTAW